jgi:phage N-6-adenine-methyltransferase
VTKLLNKRPVGRPRDYPTNAVRQRVYRQRVKQAARRRKRADHTWDTPQDLFDNYHAEFHFMLDVCALPSNAKCPRYFTPDDDGLRQAWTGVCWCNPPFEKGRVIDKWVQKAYESAKSGATVVCLLPSSTDSYWFHDYVLPYAQIEFLRKRLKFGGSRHNAPFPCLVATFRPARPDACLEQMPEEATESPAEA